jgi:hypothetical protein
LQNKKKKKNKKYTTTNNPKSRNYKAYSYDIQGDKIRNKQNIGYSQSKYSLLRGPLACLLVMLLA